MLRLKLYKELPIYYGKKCSVYVASNGYKTIETVVGKVRYNTYVVECGSSRHRYESKRLIKKKHKNRSRISQKNLNLDKIITGRQIY